MPKVSAVIPVYNTERYLSQCLESIAAQTLHDIEIICVNDGSTDSSAEMLREFASNDSRVVVIGQENQGLCAARNAGVSAATGDYLYFLDSDDYIEPETLEELHREAEAQNLDVLYFDALPFFEDSALEAENAGYKSYYSRSREYPGVKSGRELLAEMAQNNDYKPSPCLQLIRRTFYAAAHLSFYVGIVHEDNLFSMQCALQAERVEHIAKPFYRRRIREGSIMTVEKGMANFRGFFISYLEILRFVIHKGYDERTSAAIANLCSEIYVQALKVLCGLPASNEEPVAQIDSTPEGVIMYTMLMRQRDQSWKVRKLEKALKARTTELERIRTSRSYRAARYLRNLLALGRNS